MFKYQPEPQDKQVTDTTSDLDINIKDISLNLTANQLLDFLYMCDKSLLDNISKSVDNAWAHTALAQLSFGDNPNSGLLKVFTFHFLKLSAKNKQRIEKLNQSLKQNLSSLAKFKSNTLKENFISKNSNEGSVFEQNF